MICSYRPHVWLAALALILAPNAPCQCPVALDYTPGTASSRLASFEPGFGLDLYFSLDTPATGTEVWKWSPTTGMALVADVNAGSGASLPEEMTVCCTAQGPRLFFSAVIPGINRELWATDLATGVTAQVAEIHPGTTGSVPGDFVAAGPRIFLIAHDGTTGRELWVSDGTGAGTKLVKDIWVGPGWSNPSDMAALGDKVVFSADDGAGRDLWISDGTSAGTVNLSELVPTITQTPSQMTVCGGFVFFAASHPTFGETLWKTDGTAGGTTVVNTTLSFSFLNKFTRCGDRLFFTSKTLGFGEMLYVSDGTAAGTYRVQNNTAEAAKDPRQLTSSNGRLFFSGSHYASGIELWVSDGTDAGTVLAKDIYPGQQWSSPQFVTAVGTGVCFTATDGVTGLEPWFSDGTPAGTFMLCDLNPSGSSAPRDYFVVGGQLFLMATLPSIGTEPHILATPGAHLEELGVGGAPDRPTLGIRDGAVPVLGATIHIVADDGPVGHVGFLFVGIPGLPAPPLPPFMQGGCDWVGLLAGTGLQVAITAAPSLSVPITLPNQSVLEGAGLRLQMVWLGPTATPPLQMTNGVQLVLGEAKPH